MDSPTTNRQTLHWGDDLPIVIELGQWVELTVIVRRTLVLRIAASPESTRGQTVELSASDPRRFERQRRALPVDAIARDHELDVSFDGLRPGLSYTLVVETEDRQRRALFVDVPFDDLGRVVDDAVTVDADLEEIRAQLLELEQAAREAKPLSELVPDPEPDPPPLTTSEPPALFTLGAEGWELQP